MKFLRTIHAEDMEDIATGGAILGTGGGGDPYVGKLMAQQAIKQYGPVNLVDIDRHLTGDQKDQVLDVSRSETRAITLHKRV